MEFCRLGLQAIQGRGCYGAGGAIFNADNPEWRFNIIRHHKEKGMFGAKITSLYRKCVDEQLAKDLQLVDSTAETAPNFPFLLFL